MLKSGTFRLLLSSSGLISGSGEQMLLARKWNSLRIRFAKGCSLKESVVRSTNQNWNWFSLAQTSALNVQTMILIILRNNLPDSTLYGFKTVNPKIVRSSASGYLMLLMPFDYLLRNQRGFPSSLVVENFKIWFLADCWSDQAKKGCLAFLIFPDPKE